MRMMAMAEEGAIVSLAKKEGRVDKEGRVQEFGMEEGFRKRVEQDMAKCKDECC